VLGVWARDVPLTPSADDAQEWAEAELAKAIYNNEPTLLERLLDWLGSLWRELMSWNQSVGPVVLPLVVLAVVLLIVGAGILIGGPVRRRRLRRQGASAVVLDGDERTAKELRAAAEAAAGAGDFSLAVLERFRAIVRSLDERVVLEDRPGRTAHEAATEAGHGLPDCAADLLTVAQTFDAVCYGDLRAERGDYDRVVAVDEQVAAARPVRLAGIDAEQQTDAEQTSPAQGPEPAPAAQHHEAGHR